MRVPARSLRPHDRARALPSAGLRRQQGQHRRCRRRAHARADAAEPVRDGLARGAAGRRTAADAGGRWPSSRTAAAAGRAIAAVPSSTASGRTRRRRLRERPLAGCHQRAGRRRDRRRAGRGRPLPPAEHVRPRQHLAALHADRRRLLGRPHALRRLPRQRSARASRSTTTTARRSRCRSRSPSTARRSRSAFVNSDGNITFEEEDTRAPSATCRAC